MKLSWRTELPQWIVIAAMFALAAWAWPRLPERIPIHWNFRGEVDGYGNKFVGLLLMPLVAVGFYLLFLPFCFINPGQNNRAIFVLLMTALRTLLLCILASIYLLSVEAVFGRHVDWIADTISVLCFGIAALFAVIGNYSGKIRQNPMFGLRTPWTLASKYSWDKSNRMAGWLSLLMAVALIVAGMVHTFWMLALALVFVALCLTWMIVYSYLTYRADPARRSSADELPGGG